MRILYLCIILFSVILCQSFFAIELSGQTLHFRSIKSGNWNDVNIWESAEDESFTLNVSNAATVPDFKNGKINIMPETVVSINLNVHVDEVTIKSGATLILLPGNNLHVRNGEGADLLVEGTLEDKAAQGSGINFEDEASWALGETGTFIKYNTSRTSVLRDNYHEGMINIPATAHWIIRRESANQTPRFTTINTVYPNLTFENMVDDHWDPGSSTNRFTGNTGYPIIKGDLNIGGAETGSITVYNENTHLNPMAIYGNLIIQEGSVLTNKGTNDGTGIEVKGNIINEGEVDLAGGTGTLILSTPSGGELSGSGNIGVQNIQFNTSGNFIVENQLLVEHELNILSGVLIATENPIILGETATLEGEDEENYITGKIETSRTLNGNFNSFGNIGVEIDAEQNNVDLGAVKITRETGTAYPLGDTESIKRGWTINIEKAPENKVTVALQWSVKDEEDLISQDFQLYKMNQATNTWVQAEEQATFGESSVVFETDFAMETSNGMLENAEQGRTARYTIGEKSEPLPVIWLNFDAVYKNEAALLTWATASEIDNFGFTIQKSGNSKDWYDIGFIKGAGTYFGISHYKFADKGFGNKAYYRIKQVDYDGTYSFSKIIVLQENTKTGHNFEVFPNPANSHVKIKSQKTEASENIYLKCYNKTGKLLLQTEGNIDKINIALNNMLVKAPKGIFILQLGYQENVEFLKLQIMH